MGLPNSRVGAAIIWYAVLLYVGTGVILVLANSPIATIPTGVLVGSINQKAAGLLYLGAGLLTAYGTQRARYGAWLGVPQAVLLSISSVTAIVYASLGQYLDGVLRPNMFILADQLATILLPLGFLWGLLSYHAAGHD